MDLTVMAGLPLFFICLGLFSRYYTYFLFFPMTVLLFALLCVKGDSRPSVRKALAVLLWLSAIIPGSYLWRLGVQGIPAFVHDSRSRIEQFVHSVTKPGDVAWVDVNLWYATKPVVKRTFSSLWAMQAKTGMDRDAISVVITVYGAQNLECLPGKWKATGEFLEIPDFHKFYRVWEKQPPYHYEVFRRVPESS